MFANDCILFGEVSDRGIRVMKDILEEYESCSGQCVNFEKSTMFFSSNMVDQDKDMVFHVLNVQCLTNPEKYLRLPNIVGRNKKMAFQNLKDRLKQRINSWSLRHISQGGREVFIKAVLQSIPTYTMACFLFPKSLCLDLENIMGAFWWRKKQGKWRMHWYDWKSLCAFKEDGGMGFRNLTHFNIALLAKQGWRLLRNPNSLLARTFKAKYYNESDFLNSSLGNVPSFTWRSIWTSKGLLLKGLGWRIGNGRKVSIWEDSWIPEQDAKSILCIPLSRHEQDDFVIWREEPTVFVENFIKELDGLQKNVPVERLCVDRWVAPVGMRLKINFDAAFNNYRKESCSGKANMVAHVITSEGIVRREETYLENLVVSGTAGLMDEDRRSIESMRELRGQRIGEEENTF
ncbi:hypothetical protein J1N35_010625 [Gossypium stocksii]|uniref:Reverse transcriptase n=1 Tax=Gossypium stocksii TaxID=47602 RepID=A0A9D4AAQ5_9ROSI|nr:hypothetical protein J1N35_010625 [Gossypium stocksii]